MVLKIVNAGTVDPDILGECQADADERDMLHYASNLRDSIAAALRKTTVGPVKASEWRIEASSDGFEIRECTLNTDEGSYVLTITATCEDLRGPTGPVGIADLLTDGDLVEAA